jgi:hypothetical protein
MRGAPWITSGLPRAKTRDERLLLAVRGVAGQLREQTFGEPRAGEGVSGRERGEPEFVELGVGVERGARHRHLSKRSASLTEGDVMVMMPHKVCDIEE